MMRVRAGLHFLRLCHCFWLVYIVFYIWCVRVFKRCRCDWLKCLRLYCSSQYHCSACDSKLVRVEIRECEWCLYSMLLRLIVLLLTLVIVFVVKCFTSFYLNFNLIRKEESNVGFLKTCSFICAHRLLVFWIQKKCGNNLSH